MTIREVEKLLDGYMFWMKDQTSLKQVGTEWIEITTPYLDRHNDCLQIYVKKERGGFLLTDDGHIIDDLISSGIPLSNQRSRELLKLTLAGFGIEKADQNHLVARATPANFALQKHNLIQAMLAVDNLFYLAPDPA